MLPPPGSPCERAGRHSCPRSWFLSVDCQLVELLRDAMLDMWEQELGPAFTPKAPFLTGNLLLSEARIGWFSLLNYWGGGLCYFQKE